MQFLNYNMLQEVTNKVLVMDLINSVVFFVLFNFSIKKLIILFYNIAEIDMKTWKLVDVADLQSLNKWEITLFLYLLFLLLCK